MGVHINTYDVKIIYQAYKKKSYPELSFEHGVFILNFPR